MKFEKSILALMLITTLSACTFDGENGAAGGDGADGNKGSNGLDAPSSLSIELVARSVLIPIGLIY